MQEMGFTQLTHQGMEAERGEVAHPRSQGQWLGQEDLEPAAANSGAGQDTAAPQALLPEIYFSTPAKGGPRTICHKTGQSLITVTAMEPGPP